MDIKDIHDHGHGSAHGDFMDAVSEEQGETKLTRWFNTQNTLNNLAKSMDLANKGVTATSVGGDIMGMKGQAVALPQFKQFYYNKSDWAPSVAAHELGHIRSRDDLTGKIMQDGRVLGGMGSTAGLGLLGMVAKNKKAKAGLYGGALLSAAASPLLTYGEESRAWDYADKALDDLERDSWLYDSAAREAARETKEKALGTYAHSGKINTLSNVVGGGLLAGYLKRQRDKGYIDNKKLRNWGLGITGLSLLHSARGLYDQHQLDRPPEKDLAEALAPGSSSDTVKLAYAYGSLLAKTK